MNYNTNTTITTKTFSEIENAITILNSERTKKTVAEFLSAKNEIETDIKNYNTATIENRFNELLSLPTNEDLFKDFIPNRTVEKISLKFNEKENNYELSEGEATLSFVELEKTSKEKEIAARGDYLKIASIFIHNLHLNNFDELKTEGAKKLTLNKEYLELRKELDMKNYSISALEKQLNILLDAILPESLRIKAVKADVKYLLGCFSKTSNGTISIASEKRFINEVFTVIFYRKNNMPYKFQSKAAAHKEAKTVEVEA